MRRPSWAWWGVTACAAAMVVALFASASAPGVPRAQSAQTVCADLSPVSRFNTFVYGDHLIDNTQVFGRVAIGGDLRLGAQGAVTIGSDVSGPPNRERFDLIVKGDLATPASIISAGSGVSVQNGSVIHAGTIEPSPSVVNAPSGDVIMVDRSVLPERVGFDFPDTFENLIALQGVWEDLPNQVRITDQDIIQTDGNDAPIVRFVGTNSTLNVFRISARTLQKAKTIQIRVPNESATTLINVTGRLYKSVTEPTVATEFAIGSGGFATAGSGPGSVSSGRGLVRARLVWDFTGAHTVQLGGPREGNQTTAWEGNVFAPKTTVLVGPSVRVHGTVVAMRLEQTDPAGGVIGGDVRLPGLGEGACLPKTCPEPTEEEEPPPIETPTPTPAPSPTPTPEPSPEPPALPSSPIDLAPPGPSPPPDTGAVAGAAQSGSTTLKMCKRPFRPRVRAGRTVTFRLEVRNIGLATAQGVVVCDRVPAGLRLLRAPGAQVRGARACWRINSMRDEKTFHLTVRASPTARGVIHNVVQARASNAGSAAAVSRVVVVRPPPPVTG